MKSEFHQLADKNSLLSDGVRLWLVWSDDARIILLNSKIKSERTNTGGGYQPVKYMGVWCQLNECNPEKYLGLSGWCSQLGEIDDY